MAVYFENKWQWMKKSIKPHDTIQWEHTYYKEVDLKLSLGGRRNSIDEQRLQLTEKSFVTQKMNEFNSFGDGELGIHLVNQGATPFSLRGQKVQCRNPISGILARCTIFARVRRRGLNKQGNLLVVFFLSFFSQADCRLAAFQPAVGVRAVE